MSEEKGGGITFGAAVDMGGGDIISGDKMSGNVQKGDGNTMNVSGETGPFNPALEKAETDEQRGLIADLEVVSGLEATADNVAEASTILDKLVESSKVMKEITGPDFLKLVGSGLRAAGGLLGPAGSAAGYVAEASLKILADRMK